MATHSLNRTLMGLGFGLAATLLAAAMPVTAAQSPAPSGRPADCDTSEPGIVGSVDHPTDPKAIVLRMFQGGGFVPTGVAFIETPRFTLYGNDVAIFQAPVPAEADLFDPLPPFQCLKLTPDEVDELLTFALGEGGLAEADMDYANPNIMDVPTTTFTIEADGVSKTVSVYALAFDMAPEDQLEDRARFEALAELLGDFGETVDGEQPYDVPAYEGVLEQDGLEPGEPSTPWPWTDVTTDDFAVDDPMTGVVLTPEQVAMVTTVPNGGQALIPVASPDGERLRLSIRPLLPGDE